MKLVAVIISKDPVEWKVPEVPFYNHTEGYEYYPHYPRLKTRYRLDYLARRRNAANAKAVKLFPDLTHFFSLDTYYLDDVAEIRDLVREYVTYGKDVVLGASSWYIDPSRIRKRRWFWDTWTNPQFLGKGPDYVPPTVLGIPQGWEETRGAGGFTIYPRWVWEQQGYGVPEPFPESGCESNYLSRCQGIKTYISFNVKAWRDPPEELRDKPMVNRIRTSIGLRSWLRRHGVPDVYWIMKNRVLLPRRRLDWLKGTMNRDGLKWTVRGLNDSHLAYDGHEVWLKEEILRKGKLFVDIGAHVGTWSIRASRYYTEVQAFEPSNRTRKLLEKNRRLNQAWNVNIHGSALGPEKTDGVIYTFNHIRMNGGNSLLKKHPIMGGDGTVLNKVMVEPLDSYGYAPDLVKIDTEGYELGVLEGARETLQRTRKVIAEVHGDNDLLRIRGFLDRSGFKTRLVFSPSEAHVIGERRVQDSA